MFPAVITLSSVQGDLIAPEATGGSNTTLYATLVCHCWAYTAPRATLHHALHRSFALQYDHRRSLVFPAVAHTDRAYCTSQIFGLLICCCGGLTIYLKCWVPYKKKATRRKRKTISATSSEVDKRFNSMVNRMEDQHGQPSG